MPRISIDENTCARCHACVELCPAGIFSGAEGEVPAASGMEHCIGCGHCVSVCPTDSILHPGFPEGEIHGIDESRMPGYGQFMELARSRRSVRKLTDEPVSKEDIERIIEAARYAPTALNCQS